MLDFVYAEGSSGFHAPEEAARLLSLSTEHARRGLRALSAAPSGGARASR
ncbi:MAG: ammonia-forming cytochrome c nitrite reductase subunit c552 [Sandaracinaceae bacterium]|nr:ammonia-forming cytochrome c nitrite reductase subunit c552 [Sandaracinaceae bacterium]